MMFVRNLFKTNYSGEMKIFNNFTLPNNYKHCALAIGNFDGVHKGHKKVLNESKILAKKNNLKFGVMTFEPIPYIYFTKKKKLQNKFLKSKN